MSTSGKLAIFVAIAVLATAVEAAYLGCYEDTPKRILQNEKTSKIIRDAENSAAKCRQTCEGYNYYGTEYSVECFCGNELPDDAQKADESKCDMVCSGNPDEMCGGTWHISVHSADRADDGAAADGGPPPLPDNEKPDFVPGSDVAQAGL